jgi:hypothetical protein
MEKFLWHLSNKLGLTDLKKEKEKEKEKKN